MAVRTFITTNDTVAFIAPSDPSVDLEKSDIDAYIKTFDLKHLVFREPSTPLDAPTVFTLSPLGTMHRGAAIDAARASIAAGVDGVSHSVACEMVLLSLRSVTGLFETEIKPEAKSKPIKTTDDFNVTPYTLKLETIGAGISLYQRAEKKVLSLIPPEIIRELYVAICAISFPSELEKKN